ncbi:MAG: Rrf2 family transcriptional regulator [Bradymonadia bacterium]
MTSRFAISVHILGMLAVFERSKPGCSMTSNAIAKSICTHPVVVRKVMAELQRAGIIETRRGAGGGARLARCASTITLRQVYESIGRDEVLFTTPPGGPNEKCAVAPHINTWLTVLFNDIEEVLKSRLGEITLCRLQATVYDQMMACCHNDD